MKKRRNAACEESTEVVANQSDVNESRIQTRFMPLRDSYWFFLLNTDC